MRTIKSLCLVVLSCSPLVMAEEGRIPIFEPVVLDGAVTDINGSYIVSRNITLAAGMIIDVRGTGSEVVDIDLNGFMLASGVNSTVFVDNVKGDSPSQRYGAQLGGWRQGHDDQRGEPRYLGAG